MAKAGKGASAGPMNTLEIEIAIAALHSTGDFQVLRRLDLERETRFARGRTCEGRVAICLDTETTGFDPEKDKVIELGMVAFEYLPESGEITRVLGRYNGFEDPGFPLPQEIVEITGITDDMVRGQRFDDAEVQALVASASLIIAHNAAFDRKFVEARFPMFRETSWGCTVSQVDWKAERISSRSLDYLLFKICGLTIHAHRALDDAEGVLGLLLGRLPVTDAPVFQALLKNAQQTTSRLSAVGAPFDKKDILKERGYRWSDGTQGNSKAWWRDVPHHEESQELEYLAREIYPRGNADAVQIKRIDAITRFSVRE
jgi:DNA polymerase III subunit epsilon